MLFAACLQFRSSDAGSGAGQGQGQSREQSRDAYGREEAKAESKFVDEPWQDDDDEADGFASSMRGDRADRKAEVDDYFEQGSKQGEHEQRGYEQRGYEQREYEQRETASRHNPADDRPIRSTGMYNYDDMEGTASMGGMGGGGMGGRGGGREGGREGGRGGDSKYSGMEDTGGGRYGAGSTGHPNPDDRPIKASGRYNTQGVHSEEAGSKQSEPGGRGMGPFEASGESMAGGSGDEDFDEYSDDFETDSDDDEKRSETLRQAQLKSDEIERQRVIENCRQVCRGQ
jgi:hypothetical protein